VVLIGLLVVAFIAVAQIKKRMLQDEDLSGAGFSLGDLRALHRQGKMTDEEFEKAKQAMLEGLKRAAERQAQAQAQRQSASGNRGPRDRFTPPFIPPPS
jgi:hypothetical protein